ncbi:GNAT family N-acetyltransferase [Ferrimonas senticii]|uniref:GNAT family N-acetyltransferase n=1 Tax=Ferrimonas senticii TaxID=394566 RepID=UPI0004211C48|nr:N-acetyltransferase [Ferrimonas senticii]
MIIRNEQATDISAIETLTYQAFLDHPHHEPGAKPTEHLIVNRLRDAGALTLSLVAEDDGRVLGHVALSPVQIAAADSNWLGLGLGPISVLPEQQGNGIGRALMEAALAQAKAMDFDGIVLLGEPELYQRFGFKAESQLTLEGVPAEYFLAQRLSDKPLPAGAVSYHAGFYGQ